MRIFPEMRKVVCLCLVLLYSIKAYPQASRLSLVKENELSYEKELYTPGNGMHTSFRPLIHNEFDGSARNRLLNALPYIDSDSLVLTRGENPSVNPEGSELLIYPILNGELWYDYNRDNADLENALGNGVGIQATLKSKLAFNANYMYVSGLNRGFLYTSTFNEAVIPGTGQTNYTTQTKYYNHYFDGYLSYAPNKTFNFQVGQGRNFIGDGYRSMLLSDNAFNYPYLKVSTSFWKVKYVNLYAMQFDIRNADGPWSNYDRKYSSTHYLSMNIGKRLNVGLFESVIWAGRDSSFDRNFDVNYLNPIILYRPVEFSIGSPDNVLIGLNTSYKAFNNIVFYGQLLIDEFLLSEIRANEGWWGNKYGWQLGAKYLTENWKVLMEYNTARPFTYTHGNVNQNYGHMHQALAHPLGANFRELIIQAQFKKKRWIHSAKLIYINYGTGDMLRNVGQDIYRSNSTRLNEYGNRTTQGDQNDVVVFDLNTQFTLIQRSSTVITFGFQPRQYTYNVRQFTSYYVYGGIRTALFNRYLDY